MGLKPLFLFSRGRESAWWAVHVSDQGWDYVVGGEKQLAEPRPQGLMLPAYSSPPHGSLIRYTLPAVAPLLRCVFLPESPSGGVPHLYLMIGMGSL